MPRKWKRRMVKVLVSLSEELVEALDALAEDVDTSRSDVIEELLAFGLANVDEVFPEEEEEESESESDEEEEEEEED